MEDVSNTTLVVGADTVGLVVLAGVVYYDRQKIDNLSKQQLIMTRNSNVLNMNFKRWISILVQRLIGIDYAMESDKEMLKNHEKRIRELEKALAEINGSKIHNPLHSDKYSNEI
jgi:hypothetical protein